MRKLLLPKSLVHLIASCLLLVGLTSTTGYAQCPIANSCTPLGAPAANLVFGMGIFNVNVNNGAINNTTLGASQGYQDYSCTTGATLLPGVTYPISIQTNANVNENVRAWIDYNNDGTFNATIELAFSSNNNKIHTGNFTIPANAVINTPLRMRVSADNFSSPVPTPCSNPQFSQVEDYRITVTPNTNPPVAEFTASATTTCSPTVTFTDLSQNGPTSWLWNFGDPASGANNTSTLQNPSHTFSAPGTYTVTLTVTNANGTHSVTKTNFITYHNNVPVAAACTPNTISYCCGYGITNVNFGNGLITNTSANGSAGYQDFTCSKSATVIAGNPYTLNLTTGTNPQDTKVYIDLNNDGSFNNSNELVLTVLNMINPTGTITIPGTTNLNTPLRMRIVSDEIGSSFNSCSGIQTGQAEDYTLIITPNPNPPVAQFTSNYATSCDSIVQFFDQSANAPTSWLWNFGDPASGVNNTSTLQNPIHTFQNQGSYTVTLTATNSNGSNTITKTNLISIIKPCIIYCPSTGHTNTNLFISNVTLSNLNNSSGQAPSGYSNFTSQSATLIQGNPATLSVTRGGFIVNSSVSVWIDYNRNGIFEATERVMARTGSSGPATASILVPANALLGSTRMRVMTFGNVNPPTNPCLLNQFNMEVEDYTVNIQTNQQPPVVDFTVPSQITCSGVVDFSDNTINLPTTWLWNFGDPASGANNTSTLQNPSHTYATTGMYTVTLTATNSFGTRTVTKTNFINYDPTNPFCTNVVMPATGTGPDATACSGTIFDPGGPTGQYPNNADGKITIAPAGAGSVTLTFTSFDLEANWDFLRIYDGPNTNSPLINVPLSGPSIPGPITSTGSALTLHFTSDNVVTRDGFAATWTCAPVTSPPVANFSADLSTVCTGVVSFQDLSTNSPTSWLWNFGDGSPTSTLKNPTHTYSTTVPGNYTVTLTATNSFGGNTVTKTSFVNITVPCLTYCVSNGHNNTPQWISKVEFGTINQSSSAANNGYANNTFASTNVMLGTTTNPVSVTLGNNTGGTGYVAIWIDFNKDGVFQTTERVSNTQATSTTFGAPFIATGNIAVPATALTGPTRMRVIYSTNFNLTDPCISNLFRGETEDYTVNIQPNTLPVVANFTANLNTLCTGVIQFSDASLNGATSWTWDFGDGTPTSSLQNPSHTYATGTPGSYTVTLTACKNGVCSTVTKTNFINITVPCLTYCASTGHNNTNQWIGNVTFGTINNTTVAETNGYANYTYLSNSVMLGTANNSVSVTLGNNTGPGAFATIWIDYNKDGIFQTTERVFNSQAFNTGFGSPMIASGNISIPATASTGTTRMRVIISQSSNLTNPCITNNFNSEVEDYAVNIQPNTLPVVANFIANLNTICTGIIQFTDASLNGATSWTWDFGDGTPTSSLQNPSHTYATGTPGSYTVTLTACKNGVCNTVTKTNFINITVPCLTYCASTGHNNTNQWIGNVTLGTINSTTAAETNGYGNYTHLSNNMTLGTSAPVTVTLGSSSGSFSYIAIWIDLNKDGIFQSTERLFNAQATNTSFGSPITATGTLAIPANAQTGPTRMRVIMSQNFNLTDPCFTNNFNAEVEDYTVNIQPNTLPVVANFIANLNTICTGVIQFTDASLNGATSWTWDFGDGTPTSSLQNPSHTYATGTPGSYNVTLTACKNGVCSTITKNNLINITVPCLTYCVSNGHINTNQWISNLTFGTINNTTVAETNGYGNYTHLSNSVILGTGNQATVTLGNVNGPFGYVAIWADLNKDGVFQTNERIFNAQATSPSFGSPIVATGTLTIPATAQAGPTRMRVILSQNFNLTNPCIVNNFNAEVEDYTVNILPNTVPPIVNFSATSTITCDGIVAFTDLSSNAPTSWSWNFGDGSPLSTQRNPVHTYANPGTYTVTLTASNTYGPNTMVKNAYIVYDPNNPACFSTNMPISGPPVVITTCSGALYDNGGPTGDYSDGVDGTVVIAPANATSVAITFTSIGMEACCDQLTIYDGPNISSPQIGGPYTGFTLPNGGNPIIATSGVMTIRFTSDFSVTGTGFAATYSCTRPTGIADSKNEAAFDVFPNPTSGLVNLRLANNRDENYNLQVVDMIGKVLVDKKVSFTDNKVLPLDLSKLSKGVYFIRIQNDRTTGVRRVVID